MGEPVHTILKSGYRLAWTVYFFHNKGGGGGRNGGDGRGALGQPEGKLDLT